ncbi:RNA polymerase sigma factor [Methylobacter marinus]|uniref:RNA polymerase sigma factor n=1 Tax=Methylobacter marinus TaxID=34058 RepID=UPI00037EB950|nr:RNA polymerase sigma factor [Methylobacter marinus]
MLFNSGADLYSRIAKRSCFPGDLHYVRYQTSKEEKLNLEALYQQHQNELIYHVFGLLHCRDIAADIVQESYIKLSREAERQKIEHPRSLLFRIAHNLALDHLKHRKVTENHAQSLDPTLVPASESPSAEQLASEEQRQRILRRIINELPPRCRQVFIMHNLHGMSYRDIARELGISESGVEKHIMKGLLHCRKQMKTLLPE